MIKFTILGKTYEFGGKDLKITPGGVEIDGKPVEIEGLEHKHQIKLVVEGNVKGSVVSNGSVEVKGDVGGNVTARGSIQCGNVLKGHVDAGSSVQCGNVGGGVDAGASVTCASVGGDIDAGGSINVTRR